LEATLFVPNTVTAGGCHVRDAIDLKRLMGVMVLALLPSLLFGMWNVGLQHYLSVNREAGTWQLFAYGFRRVFPMLVVSYAVGLAAELLVAHLRRRRRSEGFMVSALLIVMIMPPDMPLWMLALATAFAVFGKEVFGGTGMNIFNPAILAQAFVFLSYPAYISGSEVWVAGLSEGAGVFAGFSGATPLAQMAAGTFSFSDLEVGKLLWGATPGAIGETSLPTILAGALLLAVTGVGSWRIMASVAAGGYLTGLLFNLLDAGACMSIPAHYHLMAGGFMFGAAFMATDPVTAAQTNAGKGIYGFLIGAIAVAVFVLLPAHPAGILPAILLMNVFAPLIDHCVVQSNVRRRLNRAKSKR
jgi:Na+-transporting NADH:ubiquinone oxidoreductase subunit B